MNKWVKRKWVRALRSGEYEKGAGFLGDSRGYCCLGVLACEMVPELANADGKITVSENVHYLPDDLTLLYGLNRQDAGTLANINDDADSFEPVIEWIEDNL